MQQQQQQVLGNTGSQKTAAAVNGPGDDQNGMTTVSHALSTRTDDLPNGTSAFFEQHNDAAAPLYEVGQTLFLFSLCISYLTQQLCNPLDTY